MIHARDEEEANYVIKKMSEETGIKNYAGLVSTKEYKKIRLRYFTPDWEEWEEKYKSEISEGK
jgi:hypothetical protein